MKNGSVVKRIFGLLARGRVCPLALALGEFNKVGHGLRSILLKQAANNCTLAGFNYGISSWCAGHSVLKGNKLIKFSAETGLASPPKRRCSGALHRFLFG